MCLYKIIHFRSFSGWIYIVHTYIMQYAYITCGQRAVMTLEDDPNFTLWLLIRIQKCSHY